jgi:hypothetical protein
MIADAAANPNVDLPKLQGLMALKEQVEDRRAKRAFNVALANAKGEFGPILKTRLVDYAHKDERGRTSYRHEEFADIAQVVDPVLSKYGLSYRHKATQEAGKVKVTCILSHADGFSEENSLEALEDKSGQKNPIQAVGSTITYLQRYTLKEALGIAAAHDDDGHGGGADPDQAVIGLEEMMLIEQQLRDTESDQAKFLETLGAASLAALTVKQFSRGKALLAEKKRRASKAAS